VGCFSAGWQRLAGQGMARFAAGGRARCAIIREWLKRMQAIIAWW
jgi:hypothetical protein